MCNEYAAIVYVFSWFSCCRLCDILCHVLCYIRIIRLSGTHLNNVGGRIEAA